MKMLNVAYSTSATTASFCYNNLGRRQKTEELSWLPGLKCTVEDRIASQRTEQDIMVLSQAASDGNKEMAIILERLLSGKSVPNWKIVEIRLDGGHLNLRLANQNGLISNAEIHGSQFPRTMVALTFEGQRDTLTVTLCHCEVRCFYENDSMIDAFRLKSPEERNNHCWYFVGRQETTW